MFVGKVTGTRASQRGDGVLKNLTKQVAGFD
jgi:hypothetical protein